MALMVTDWRWLMACFMNWGNQLPFASSHPDNNSGTVSFSNDSNQSDRRSLLLPVLCIATVVVSILKDACFIELMRELRN
jgi:hypothetical protein